MSRTPFPLLSPADQERARSLTRMKAVALGALIFMAIVFVVAFWLQERFTWLAYVRAAAEGGMVGALADWFAVTALFRRPLGLPIPHTAIIPNRKDEIGRTLGEFVETNFLSSSGSSACSSCCSRRCTHAGGSVPPVRSRVGPRHRRDGLARARGVTRARGEARGGMRTDHSRRRTRLACAAAPKIGVEAPGSPLPAGHLRRRRDRR